MKVEKFICLFEKRSLEDCNSVSESCLGEMQSEAAAEDVIQNVANEVAEAVAEQTSGDGNLTIEIQVKDAVVYTRKTHQVVL